MRAATKTVARHRVAVVTAKTTGPRSGKSAAGCAPDPDMVDGGRSGGRSGGSTAFQSVLLTRRLLKMSICLHPYLVMAKHGMGGGRDKTGYVSRGIDNPKPSRSSRHLLHIERGELRTEAIRMTMKAREGCWACVFVIVQCQSINNSVSVKRQLSGTELNRTWHGVSWRCESSRSVIPWDEAQWSF
jgi:hypothetical protein